MDIAIFFALLVIAGAMVLKHPITVNINHTYKTDQPTPEKLDAQTQRLLDDQQNQINSFVTEVNKAMGVEIDEPDGN